MKISFGNKEHMKISYGNNEFMKIFIKMIWIYSLCTLATMLLVTGFSLKTIGLTIIISSFFITLNAMGYYVMLIYSRLNEIIRNQQEIIRKLNESTTISIYDEDQEDDFNFSKN